MSVHYCNIKTTMNTPTPTPRTDAFAIIASPSRNQYLDFAEQLERELTTVTEQRDSYKDRFESLLKRYAIETHQLTEQRDRLAEAMQTIIRIYENADKGCIPSSSDMYDEALQSLTTTEP